MGTEQTCARTKRRLHHGKELANAALGVSRSTLDVEFVAGITEALAEPRAARLGAQVPDELDPVAQDGARGVPIGYPRPEIPYHSPRLPITT